ncbi:MAG TPA: STAS domain-containing protein [Thermoanaerobaculia bacterium]|jgi:anti-anti-sigma factor|nr:STAS domain-containing protein [Thermoanaerobaculia bacterium]
MVIVVEKREVVTVVSIDGSVDGTTARELTASFRAQVAGGSARLVGNLAGVDYTSSAGLRALLETVKETRQHGGDLRLAAVRPEVLRILELSGFTSILQVFDDVDAAVASFAA